MGFPAMINNMNEASTFISYTTEWTPVGTKATTEDGRTYRFVEVGASALTVARLVQAEVPTLTDLSDQAVGTLAAGATTITGVGSTNTTYAADALKHGWVFFDSVADTNPAYRIKGNTAIAGATLGTISLWVPLQAAVAAATTISYCKNPWRDVIVKPASAPTAQVVGVPIKAIAANEFGWVQTGGPCRILVEGTLIAGDAVVPSQSAAGGVAPSGSATDPQIGYVMVLDDTTETALIYLTID